MISSGSAKLPLHYGKVPPWLYERMEKIGLSITEMILEESGTEGFLSRISDPHWFQALGCVMGMDWHSSGITTSVLGALKRAVNAHSSSLGLAVCGGRGNSSRKTPAELEQHAQSFGIAPAPLVLASRLSAKIDNTCVDDGYQLYLHTCFADRTGNWAVVQQGMNTTEKMARRYHWHSRSVSSFVDDPQSAIVGKSRGTIMNLVDHRSQESRSAVVDFISRHPDAQTRELARLGFPVKRRLQRELFMPEHHEVTASDLDAGRLGAVLALAYEQGVTEFSQALLIPGVGPRTVQALALVSEVAYGKPNRFTDPARFSFAHGGKDGHPFPVPLHTYDQTISTLSSAVRKAGLGRTEELAAVKRLSRMSEEIEKSCRPHADVEKVIEYERSISERLGGKTCLS